jgi:mono/diheme cytochrome c family protein
MTSTIPTPQVVNTVAGCYGANPPCLNLPTPGAAVGYVPSSFMELVLIFLFVALCEGLLYGFQVWVNRKGGDPLETRSSYSAVISLGLAWVLIIVVGAWWLNQGTVLAQAGNNQLAIQEADGAALFAQYCVACHGPRGEGVIGAPLNIPELRGSVADNPAVFSFLTQTIAQGRPGYVSPTWVKAPDGHWQSETAMPAWSQDAGGPLTDAEIDDLATFIMMGDWTQVASDISGVAPPNPNGPWPKSSLPPAQQQAAQQTIEAVGCLACHTIGGRGAHIGPDITLVAQWSKDPGWKQFIYDWIKDPATMSQQQLRAPIYWNPQFPHTSPTLVYGQTQKMALPDTFMPKLTMTDQQRQQIVDYLFSIQP